MPACSCAHGCTSREEMRLRHGTPFTFSESLVKALGEISTDEANAALEKYTREYEAAPEGAPEMATKRKCMRCLQEVETKRGGLAWHKCAHNQVCVTSDSGGPKRRVCRKDLEKYWADRKET